jgi:hypothetical protein
VCRPPDDARVVARGIFRGRRKALGRQIIHGENGIAILAPMRQELAATHRGRVRCRTLHGSGGLDRGEGLVAEATQDVMGPTGDLAPH